MARRVNVTGAEQSAARYLVRRNAERGVETPAPVTRIANAKVVSGRQPSPSPATKGSRAS